MTSMMKIWLRLTLWIIVIALIGSGLYLRFVKGLVWAGWTGFDAKTLWEWLNLLIFPAALVFAVIWFTKTLTIYQLKILQERADKERVIALDNLREQTLKVYFEMMTRLLLEKDLRVSEPGSEVRLVARVQTLNALRSLDCDRKGSLLGFLYETNLIMGDNAVVLLNGADFQGVNLAGVPFPNINLSGVNLQRADFDQAVLTSANFSKANLNNTNFTNAKLQGANLNHAEINNAKLSNASFRNADLSYANINSSFILGSNFTDANLESSILIDCNLSEANFTGANLKNARLYASNLKGAILSKPQIELASLSNTAKIDLQ